MFEKSGGLVVFRAVTFKEETIFAKTASFFGDIVFQGKALFKRAPTFSKDTAGYALIKEGDKKVSVRFEHAYASPPIVNATLSLQSADESEVRTAKEQLLLLSDVSYIITDAVRRRRRKTRMIAIAHMIQP